MKYNMMNGDVILGRYKIIKLIGRGGESEIAKAKDLRSGQIVVVKHLTAHILGKVPDVMIKRFQRAANARFNHPNIVDSIELGEDDGEWFLIMPFINGKNLKNVVQENQKPLEISRSVRIIIAVASGLEAMHRQGYVNRDIKPENIMLSEKDHPSIIDMGIIKDRNEQTLTEGNGLLGTLPFMSPEQVMDPTLVDPVSDIYSLGAVLYFLLTCNLVVDSSQGTATMIKAIFDTQPPAPSSINSSVPRTLDQTILKMLAKSPQDRFQSASEVIDALKNGDKISVLKPVSVSPQAANVPLVRLGPYIDEKSFHSHDAGRRSLEPVRCLACGAPVSKRKACGNCGRSFGIVDHRLTFKAGLLAGCVFRIPEGKYFTGRTQLSGRDLSISRRHLFIRSKNGSVYITDAGSTNGTYLSGQFVECLTPLSDSREIQLCGNIAIYTVN